LQAANAGADLPLQAESARFLGFPRKVEKPEVQGFEGLVFDLLLTVR